MQLLLWVMLVPSESGYPGELARASSRLIAGGGRATEVVVQHLAVSETASNELRDEGGGAAYVPVAGYASILRDALAEEIGRREDDSDLTLADWEPTSIGLHSHERGTGPLEQLRFSVERVVFLADVSASLGSAAAGRSFESGRVRGKQVGRRFSGSIPPNPGFLYDFAETIEVLLSYGTSWTASYRDALFLTGTIAALAEAAAKTANAPIVFLQAPVAPPPTDPAGDGSREAKRRAMSNAIRMSVAIKRGGDASRIDFLRAVERLASDCGLSLSVSDFRGGRSRGEWFQVRSFDSVRFDDFCRERYESVAEQSVDRVVSLTVVGPARTGSTLAAIDQLLAAQVGLVACSISSLSETAVINLLLAVAPTVGVDFAASSGGYERSAEKGLRGLERLCALGERSSSPRVGMTRLSDYHVLRTEVFSFAGDGLPGHYENVYPLWIAWELPDRLGGVDALLSLLLGVADAEVAHLEFPYARSRALDSGYRRGRAKAAVRLRPGIRSQSVSTHLRHLAEDLETALRSALLDLDPETGRGTVRVTSRERWMGRVQLPI